MFVLLSTDRHHSGEMMTALSSPTAKRLQRPTWKDSRLAVGVLLILISATLGAHLVGSADDRVPVFVVGADVAAGDAVTPAALKRVEVRLGDGTARYLTALGVPAGGSVFLRDLRAGELVPASAVGSAAQVGVQRLTVPVDARSAVGLLRGTRVDVYVSRRSPGESPDTKPKAVRALDGVAVADVLPVSSGLGSSSQTSVQVYVPSEQVRALVEAIDSDAKVTLVPIAGALTGPVS